MVINDHPIIVIGAGPAGLTAAYEMVKKNQRPIVLEKGNKMGGLARTEIYQGYRFDIGGHRFFTQIENIKELWEEMLAQDFLKVRRRSRILHQNHFFNYPLHLWNTLGHLGVIESIRVLSSYLKARVYPLPKDETFEQWIINRFGSRLYQKFFKSYTEKVWGIPCHWIQADWAVQRIKGLSFASAMKDIFLNSNQVKTLVNEFQYPILGSGMMWDSFKRAIEKSGGQILLNTEVIRLKREDSQIKEIIACQNGKVLEMGGEHFISAMPLTELITRLDPLPPDKIIESARQLKYRALILIGLILDRSHLFDDQWIYIHDPEVRVGRIQNYKNWSIAMMADPTQTSLGMEYFCDEGDKIWNRPDQDLIDLAIRELTILGLATATDLKGGVVFRQPKAYPVYDRDYRKHLNLIQAFLKTIRNLQTIGRNGLHRYNNQDHSMLTGILAVSNLLGEHHDLWDMNEETFYQEEFNPSNINRKKVGG